MNKLKEIDIIMNLNVDSNKYLNSLIQKYKNELDGFTYLSNINDVIQLKNAYIRYISVKGLIGYGGFYYKVINENNKFYILLINQKRETYKISFDDNFIFYKTIENNNDQKRNFFTKFLSDYY